MASRCTGGTPRGGERVSSTLPRGGARCPKNGRCNRHSLSAREDQILRHITFGLTNEEIARSHGIGVETVKEHLQKMLRNIKLPDRTAAAVWVLKAGVVEGAARDSRFRKPYRKSRSSAPESHAGAVPGFNPAVVVGRAVATQCDIAGRHTAEAARTGNLAGRRHGAPGTCTAANAASATIAASSTIATAGTLIAGCGSTACSVAWMRSRVRSSRENRRFSHLEKVPEDFFHGQMGC